MIGMVLKEVLVLTGAGIAIALPALRASRLSLGSSLRVVGLYSDLLPRAVELRNESVRGRSLFLKACSDQLGLTENAQSVHPCDFARVRVRVATAKKLSDEIRVFGHVFEADRSVHEAVEVRAEPDVVDPGDAPDMVDVVGDLLEGGAHQRILASPSFELALLTLGIVGIESCEARPLSKGSGVVLSRPFRDEIGNKIHHYHAAVFGEAPQHVVGNVAAVIDDGPTPRRVIASASLSTLR